MGDVNTLGVNTKGDGLYVLSIITSKNGAPLIWSIPFDSTTSVGFTIAVQSQKRATVARSGNRAFVDDRELTG